MKKLLSFLIAGATIAALSATLTACNEPKDPNAPDLQEGVEVPFAEYSFEEGIPGETVSVRWINLNENDKATILIINSDKELKEHIEGDYPPVDLSKKTVILAYKGPQDQYLFQSDKQSFTQTSENSYIMTVNILPFAGTVIGGWQTAIVVDKLPSDVDVKLNVTLDYIKP